MNVLFLQQSWSLATPTPHVTDTLTYLLIYLLIGNYIEATKSDIRCVIAGQSVKTRAAGLDGGTKLIRRNGRVKSAVKSHPYCELSRGDVVTRGQRVLPGD